MPHASGPFWLVSFSYRKKSGLENNNTVNERDIFVDYATLTYNAASPSPNLKHTSTFSIIRWFLK
jgi:hypothetical protein